MRLPTSEEQPPEPYCYPSLNLFNATSPDDEAGAAREMKKNADILVNTLDSFGVKTTMLDICRGPSVTRYELQPQAGIKAVSYTHLFSSYLDSPRSSAYGHVGGRSAFYE